MRVERWTIPTVAGLVMLLWQTASWSLPDDREQPIRITADWAERNEHTSATRYVGNVVLTQGSLVINAEQLSVRQPDDEPVTIIATGAPAKLQQTPAEGETPIQATAGRIVYSRSDDQIRLTEGARIQQNGAVVTGAVIDYLVSEQRVRAAGAPDASGQRVEVVIPPEALQGEQEN